MINHMIRVILVDTSLDRPPQKAILIDSLPWNKMGLLKVNLCLLQLRILRMGITIDRGRRLEESEIWWEEKWGKIQQINHARRKKGVKKTKEKRGRRRNAQWGKMNMEISFCLKITRLMPMTWKKRKKRTNSNQNTAKGRKANCHVHPQHHHPYQTRSKTRTKSGGPRNDLVPLAVLTPFLYHSNQRSPKKHFMESKTQKSSTRVRVTNRWLNFCACIELKLIYRGPWSFWISTLRHRFYPRVKSIVPRKDQGARIGTVPARTKLGAYRQEPPSWVLCLYFLCKTVHKMIMHRNSCVSSYHWGDVKIWTMNPKHFHIWKPTNA
mmetsp:Transcript_36282/g.53220  ORF Transcript_36282/g.53220 Transcript_36282/m.53220 type:complete len:323 (-) Transcript_36282:2183-3151(-)